MTGISVERVNISIADVQMQKQARVKKTEIKNSQEE